MSRKYEPEFKRKIVRVHLEEGRTYKSITDEYVVSKTAIQRWCEEFSKECPIESQDNPTAMNSADLMKENLRLRRELEDVKKENLFPKKRRHSLRRKLVDSLLVHRRIQGSVWRSLAPAPVKHLPECLL